MGTAQAAAGWEPFWWAQRPATQPVCVSELTATLRNVFRECRKRVGTRDSSQITLGSAGSSQRGPARAVPVENGYGSQQCRSSATWRAQRRLAGRFGGRDGWAAVPRPCKRFLVHCWTLGARPDASLGPDVAANCAEPVENRYGSA